MADGLEERAHEPDAPDWGPPPTRSVPTPPQPPPFSMAASSTSASAVATAGSGSTAAATIPAEVAVTAMPDPTTPALPLPPPPAVGDRIPTSPHGAQGRASSAIAPKPKRTVPAASPVAVAATIVAAFVLGLGFQSRLASVSLLVGTLLLGATVLAGPDRRKPAVLIPLGLAVAAVVVAMLRSSPWVVVPAVLVGGAGLTVGAADRLFTRSGWWSLFGRQMLDLVDSPAWLARATEPFRRGRVREPAVLRGILLALVIVAPVAALLASADAAFDGVLQSALDGGAWPHIVITALLTPVAASLVVASRRTDRTDEQPERRTRFGTMTEGTIILGAMAALLAAWGATQVAVALGGAERLLATSNLTAAENARSGFFQLVAVAVILIGLIAAVDRFTTRTSAGDRVRFLVLTAVIGIETVGLVAAAYSRLALYIGGFGHTMLRTATVWFLAWLALAMIVVVAAVNRPSPTDRPAAGDWATARGVLFASAAAWVVAFGLWNPEARVAAANLDRVAAAPVADRGIDSDYLLDRLGPDAIPVIADQLDEFDGERRSAVEARLCRSRPTGDRFGVMSWNRSVAEARDAVDALACDNP